MKLAKSLEKDTKTDGLHYRFQKIRRATEELCANLKTEDYVVQPVVDVSPPKWHLAHTTWFFEHFILKAFKPDYQEFNKDYGYLFNSYYETVGERVLRTDRGNLTRPEVKEIYNYRSYVNQQISELLQQSTTAYNQLQTVLELGLQHEQQHQELLATDIKYILGHNPLFPALFPPDNKLQAAKNGAPQPNNYLNIPAGLYDIGFRDNGFCFDNELGAHKVYLEAYKISSRLVTNAEYLKFMQDGGYKNFRHWLQEGWGWVNENAVTAPLYWHFINGEWQYYTLHGLKPVDMQAPVTHISFYEADAFARWKGMRLPTEFEWEAACHHYNETNPAEANFAGTRAYQPRPAEADSLQFWGDCWEWTNSAYLPYPYYKTAEGALGEYNGKFMVNQMVLRGGSCATPEDHFRISYRNFFHPHLRWQFTGLRLACHQ